MHISFRHPSCSFSLSLLSLLSHMDPVGIVQSLESKTILVTGATGFLAKLFIEKVLRVQPNVKRLYLLLRAADAELAEQRLHGEVISKELFRVLREEHGSGFDSFISKKVIAIAGDVAFEHLGIGASDLREEMWREIDIVVNMAATTRFDERYDVALNVNSMGAKHVLSFAKRCIKLQMLFHTSTGYVAGEQAGIILEKPFRMGESLNKIPGLDIQQELKLAEEKLKQLRASGAYPKTETNAMKELGLNRARHYGWANTYSFTKAIGEMLLGEQFREKNLPLIIFRPTIITSTCKEPFPGWIEGLRTIDAIAIGYGKGKITFFAGNPETVLDMIPGDMVVNAMIVAMIAHANQRGEFIYQVGSSLRNPAKLSLLPKYFYHYFSKHPCTDDDGKPIKVGKMKLLKSMDSFHKYIAIRFMLPLKVFWLLNIATCRALQSKYSKLNEKLSSTMRLVKLYEPYLFFKGIFDDSNSEKLRKAMRNGEGEHVLCFDPKGVDWDDYIMNIHLPGLKRITLTAKSTKP